MGVVQNIIGMIRDIHAHQDAATLNQDKVNAFNANFSPDSIHAMAQDDPDAAMAYQDANNARLRNNATADLGLVRDTVRGGPGTDPTASIEAMRPFLTSHGVSDDTINNFKAAAATNPNIMLDPKAYDALMKDQFTTHVMQPGAVAERNGAVLASAPFQVKPVTTPAGATTNTFNPNNPSAPFAAGGGGGGPSAMTVEGLRPLFLAQESHGDYGAINKGSGTLGAYQINPADGPRLAAAAGVAWRPDLMHGANGRSPQGVQYQDALGKQRIQEAISSSGGDPAAAFSQYYSGSPTAYQRPQGNPKTAAYVQQMMGRFGGASPSGGAPAAGPTVTPTGVTNPPKPPAGGPVRAATPEEIKAAGYPAGTAAQIDGNGKFINMKVPSAASAKNMPTIDKYNEAKGGLDELEKNLLLIRNDPGLSSGTGIVGHVAGLIPGTHQHYLQGLVDQVNAQKMISLLAGLQASGGNPFQRVTNMEAQTLPKTLGNINLNQNASDLQANIDRALNQVRTLRSRATGAAQRAGLVDQNGNPTPINAAPAAAPTSGGPVIGQTFVNRQTGQRIRWNGKGWDRIQ